MTEARRLTPAEDSAPDTAAPRRKTAKSNAAPKSPRRRSAKADAGAPAVKPARAKTSRAKTATVEPGANPPRARTRKVATVEPDAKQTRAQILKAAAAQPAQVVTLPILTQDQPLGQAAQEIARIRAEMQSIRHMIDGQPVIHSDARMMLQRLCQDQTPRGMLAGSTASVIQLAPHLRRQIADVPEDSVPAARPRRSTGKARGRTAAALALPDTIDESPIADALPQEALAPVVVAPAVPAPAVPRSRIARLLSAWGDWLLWRLLPPAMPVQASEQAPVTAPVLVRGSAASDIAGLPQGHASAGDGPDRPRGQDAAPAPQLPVAQIVAQTVAHIMDDKTMRAHLQEMIREELEGEMGARFSGNLRAVVRREIASALDERLTHL